MEYRDQSSSHPGRQAGASFEVYACPSCEESSVVLDPDAVEPRCHGASMEAVGTLDLTPTELAAVLADAHDVPRSGSEVCCALLAEGLSSTAAIAERLGRDPGTVRSHLQRLVDAGLLDRATLPREDDGSVVVYALTDDGRPPTLAEFCAWAARASGDAPAELDGDPAATVRSVATDV
jgi:predicted transcriptional regulator